VKVERRTAVKVVFIAGWQRSGSTLLHRMLGQIDGFFPAGELWYIWEQGVLENRLCGCGSRFWACPFWTEVFELSFDGMATVDGKRMMQAVRAGSRTRYLPRYWTSAGRKAVSSRLTPELDVIQRVYQALRAVTGSDFVVDSSKSPGYAKMLSMISEVELYVVHLIRDPRAAAYSWQRKKLQIDTATKSHMPKMSPGKSAIMWNLWNMASENIQGCGPDHYVRVRYEDLIANPRYEVERIISMTGAPIGRLDFINGRNVHLDRTHTISGNPNRFESGAIELRADEEWRNAMDRVQQKIVTCLTRPLLTKYGYLPGGAGTNTHVR